MPPDINIVRPNGDTVPVILEGQVCIPEGVQTIINGWGGERGSALLLGAILRVEAEQANATWALVAELRKLNAR